MSDQGERRPVLTCAGLLSFISCAAEEGAGNDGSNSKNRSRRNGSGGGRHAALQQRDCWSLLRMLREQLCASPNNPGKSPSSANPMASAHRCFAEELADPIFLAPRNLHALARRRLHFDLSKGEVRALMREVARCGNSLSATRQLGLLIVDDDALDSAKGGEEEVPHSRHLPRSLRIDWV